MPREKGEGPTQADIAGATGRSLQTVGRVLRGDAGVSATTIQAVRESAKTLGYKERREGRPSGLIGVVVPQIDDGLSQDVLGVLYQFAAREGFGLLPITTGGEAVAEVHVVAKLDERNVDGIIVIEPRSRKEELLRIREDRPMVVINAASSLEPTEGMQRVDVEHAAAMNQALEYLLREGHEQIGFLSGPFNSSLAKLKRRAYEGFLQEKGLYHPNLVVLTDSYRSDYTTGYTACDHLLRTDGIMPTAVIADSDQQAVGALRAIKDLTRGVPEEISVVGWGNTMDCEYVNPRLTSVDVSAALVAEQALGMVRGLFGGERVLTSQVQLPTRLVIRDSSGPAPGKQ